MADPLEPMDDPLEPMDDPLEPMDDRGRRIFHCARVPRMLTSHSSRGRVVIDGLAQTFSWSSG